MAIVLAMLVCRRHRARRQRRRVGCTDQWRSHSAIAADATSPVETVAALALGRPWRRTGDGVRAVTGATAAVARAVAAIVRGAAAGGGADRHCRLSELRAGHPLGGRLSRYEAARVSSRSTALMKLARASCIASPRGSNTCRSKKEARQRESIAELVRSPVRRPPVRRAETPAGAACDRCHGSPASTRHRAARLRRHVDRARRSCRSRHIDRDRARSRVRPASAVRSARPARRERRGRCMWSRICGERTCTVSCGSRSGSRRHSAARCVTPYAACAATISSPARSRRPSTT